MSSRATGAQRDMLLPSARGPRVAHVRSRSADAFDALFALVTLPASAASFAHLPQPGRWRELHARTPAKAGTVRTTHLGNRRHTLLVLGYLKAGANAFERLSLAGRMLKEAAAHAPRSVALAAPDEPAGGHAGLEALLAATLAHAFSLPSFRAPERAHAITRVALLGGGDFDPRYALAVARGTNLVRWLTALPPNVLDAHGYRTALTRLARAHGLTLRWLDERALKRLGANAFLAVAAANAEAGAGIAHLSYRPARGRAARADVALVGKGILFDTGGVNLKSHRSMLDMHTDMSGSAVALATLLALAELKAPLAADAWLAITENRIGPRAYKPQDVIRAANGVTIQVVHSDAEGRMVLADTLALAGRTRPRLMLDFATLTGACVYALTDRMSGVFTNRDALAARLVEAGRVSGERVWAFPFAEDYDTDIESKVADVAQCALEGKGDHIIAARFLGRFVPEETPWVHVDLAAATRSGGLGHVATEVTGFGVRFALELLLGQDLPGALE